MNFRLGAGAVELAASTVALRAPPINVAMAWTLRTAQPGLRLVIYFLSGASCRAIKWLQRMTAHASPLASR